MRLSTIIGAMSSIIAVDGALLRNTNMDVKSNGLRSLQIFNFRATLFQLARIPILPAEAEQFCSDRWDAFVLCTALECPNVTDACPSSIFYHGDGSAPNDALEGLDCSIIEQSFCNTYGAEGCCMMQCQDEIQELASCIIEATVKQRLKCDAYKCTTPSPTHVPSSNPTSSPSVSPTKYIMQPTPAKETEIFLADEDEQVEAPENSNAEPVGDGDFPRNSTTCAVKGEVFTCTYLSFLGNGNGNASQTNATQINATVTCSYNETVGLDVHDSADCECRAIISHHDDDPAQTCGCSICGKNGSLPVSLDCRVNEENPFIVDDCPTLNCEAACMAPEEETFLQNFHVELFADPNTIAAIDGRNMFGGFFPTSFVPALGKIFFQASAESTGYELWVSDASRNGTHLLKDIVPGKNSSLAAKGSLALDSAELGGRLIFFADEGVHEKSMWRTNGTEGGTVRVKTFGSKNGTGVTIRHDGNHAMVSYGGHLYFTVAVDGEPDKLWTTDGTRNGTTQVKGDSIFPSSLKITSLIQVSMMDGRTYFVASDDSEDSGLFVYASDGTVKGTRVVSKAAMVEQDHVELVEFGGKIYFSAGSLWATDGTANGTVEIEGPNGAFSKPRSMTAVEGFLYFWSDCQLWRTDGDGSGFSKGFIQLFDGNRWKSTSCTNELVSFGSKVLFRGGNGGKAYLTDGTTEGTFRLAAANMTRRTSFVVYNDRLAFFATERADAEFGHELWATDGTLKNTWPIPNIGLERPGLYAHLENLFVFGDAVYMTVWYLFGPGEEIWRVGIRGDEYTLKEEQMYNGTIYTDWQTSVGQVTTELVKTGGV